MYWKAHSGNVTVLLSPFEVGDITKKPVPNPKDYYYLMAEKNGETDRIPDNIKNGIARKEDMTAFYQNYWLECVAERKWRLPTYMELIYAEDNKMVEVYTSYVYRLAMDGYKSSVENPITFGAINPVSLGLPSDSHLVHGHGVPAGPIGGCYPFVQLVRTLP